MTIRRWECRQKWKCCGSNPKYCSSPKGQAKTDAWAVIRRWELDTSIPDSTGVESNLTPWYRGITPRDTSGENGTTSWKGASAQVLQLPFSLLEVRSYSTGTPALLLCRHRRWRQRPETISGYVNPSPPNRITRHNPIGRGGSQSSK